MMANRPMAHLSRRPHGGARGMTDRVLLILGVCCFAAFGQERPPNVVVIFTDDQGYSDVGCFGAKGFETPNLDRMASEGMRFTSFYVSQPVCGASRASLLTGCYANRIGLLGAPSSRARHGIAEGETTIAELLKQRGYATAIYGKWHLGHRPRFLPTRHGFDEYFGLPYSNDMWPFNPRVPGRHPPLPIQGSSPRWRRSRCTGPARPGGCFRPAPPCTPSQ